MKHLIIAILITFVAVTTVSAEETKSEIISPEDTEVIIADSTQFIAVITDSTNTFADTTSVKVIETEVPINGSLEISQDEAEANVDDILLFSCDCLFINHLSE